MAKLAKVTLAGTIAWTAAVVCYNAIFPWADWPGSSDGEIVLLSLLPPFVTVLGFFLLKWALGEAFLDWIKGNQSRISSFVIIGLIALSVFNSSTAAENAASAEYAATEARDACT